MKPIKEQRLAICCDHAGFELKQIIISYLFARKVELKDFGTYSIDSCDYADFAHAMANALERKDYDYGISICGSGNGINMTMNKHQHIRAALCWSEEVARVARLHNNANVLSLPARFISVEEVLKIVEVFFETDFEGGRHQGRIDKIPCC